VRVLREHIGLVVLVAVGAVLRVLVMVAYPQVFWYTDSVVYVGFSRGWQPDYIRQSGYSLFLKVFRHLGSPYLVSGFQHLLGLGLAIAIYALLRRRRLPKWLSLLAVAPLLLDGFQLTLEHFVLAETLFTTLIVAGLLALLWAPRPGVVATGAAGVLLAASVCVRVVSLPLVLLTIGYLIARRVGWQPVVAFVACAALPLAGYVLWFHHFYQQYGFTTWEGTFLYGRVAPFADCERLRLTPAERAICPPQPVGERPVRSDWYIWSAQSPGGNATEDTKLGFAKAAFTQQPVTMAGAIARETVKYLVPNEVEPDWVCAREGLLIPADPPTGPDYAWCQPNPRQRFSITVNPATMPTSSPLTHALGGYAHLVQAPRLLLGGSVVLALLACVIRPRRRVDGGAAADVVLLGGWGVGLLLLSVTGSIFDERYGLPSLAILPAAGALALNRLYLLRRASPPTNVR
jgi:hypothetical protein